MSISRRSRGEAAPTEPIPAETFAQVAGQYEAEWQRHRGETCRQCGGCGFTATAHCVCPAGDRQRAFDEASALDMEAR